jgi:type IV secretory pathway ATPase VirB11/archaellum biosynthesis ATPase
MGASNKLGWGVLPGAAEYKTGFVRLSVEEETLVLRVCEEFSEGQKSGNGQDAGQADALSSILDSMCEEEGIELEGDQHEYLLKYCIAHSEGTMFLPPLLSDDSIEEIAIIGLGLPSYVYVRKKGWKKTDGAITHPDSFIHLVNGLSRSLGRRITLQSPRLNAILPSGYRLHASMPPISNHELTIRRFRANPFTPSELCELSTISYEAAALLWLAMQSDASMLVCGNTASGKTSTLNALFSFVPQSERVLITEETPEIRIPHPHQIRLLSNTELGIGMQELVSDSLRMRPDRVIVGEVRTREEAQALAQTLLSGQARGSYATFHAQSAQEALARLRSFGVLDDDLLSLSLIIVQRRISKYEKGVHREIRRVTEICEIPKAGSLSLRTLFSFDHEKGALCRHAPPMFVSESICQTFDLTEDGLKKELSARARFLKSISRQNFGKFCSSISEYGAGAPRPGGKHGR